MKGPPRPRVMAEAKPTPPAVIAAARRRAQKVRLEHLDRDTAVLLKWVKRFALARSLTFIISICFFAAIIVSPSLGFLICSLVALLFTGVFGLALTGCRRLSGRISQELLGMARSGATRRV